MKTKTLTKTEIKILELIAKGLTDKEIAKTVGRSANTMHVHSANIRRKLGISNRAKLIIFAFKNGIAKI